MYRISTINDSISLMFILYQYFSASNSTPSTTHVPITVTRPSISTEPPKAEHRNATLEKIIAENDNCGRLNLSGQNLTDEDMLIVAYYAQHNNKVSIVLWCAVLKLEVPELCLPCEQFCDVKFRWSRRHYLMGFFQSAGQEKLTLTGLFHN